MRELGMGDEAVDVDGSWDCDFAMGIAPTSIVISGSRFATEGIDDVRGLTSGGP